MVSLIKHFWLGLALIAITSCILLFSDTGNRKYAHKDNFRKGAKIAILQITSTSSIDDSVTGILEELTSGGYVDGKTATIKRYNASGDYATCVTIAREIAGGNYDIVITAGTPTLQAMAAANRDGRVKHIFGCVTDPYGSGVGITGPEPDQHPAHLAGIGTFQPVEKSFELARQMNPSLSRVGTVWNPTEHNSEACVEKARAKCKELGITLIEANASNTSEVPEAVHAVLAQNVDALWIGGDIVTIGSTPMIIESARKANIPVFTNQPTDSEKGAIFALGSSYIEVGHIVGRMALRVLSGEDMRTFRVENVVPERLTISKDALATFSASWKATSALMADAEASKTSAKDDKKAADLSPKPGRIYKVGILYSVPHKLFDEVIVGIRKGFADKGFVEGKNLDITINNGNGEASMMVQLAINAQGSDRDLIMPLSTPCLAACAGRIKDKPVVFGEVTEPVGAGAGKSFTDHQSNITGAVAPAPLKGGFQWLLKLYPNIKKIGMIYTPSEPNVMTEVKIAKEFAKDMGFELVLKAASNPNEVPEALNAMMAESIDAFFLEGDNAIMSAEPLITETCMRYKIPILGDDESEMGKGELLACGVSPFGNGYFASQLAMRIFAGEDPAKIPFTPCMAADLSVDLNAAKKLGIELPADLIKEASIFHNVSARFDRPAKIAIVNYSQNISLDAAEKGFVKGLDESGLVKDKDYVLQHFNVAGDSNMLIQTIDAAINSSPDLIVTISTPVTVAMGGRNAGVPVVFSVCSDPGKIGLGDKVKNGKMTGVYEVSPVSDLVAMTMKRCPGIKKIGTIYNPSEINSRLAVEGLRECCKKENLILVEKSVSSLTDLPNAAQAMIGEGVGAVLSSADNLMCSGLQSVAKVLKPAGIPIFTTDTPLLDLGATAVVGIDYTGWGRASAKMAVKILAGLEPSELPPSFVPRENMYETDAEGSKPVVTDGNDKPWKIYLVGYNVSSLYEDSIRGVLEAFKKSGFKEGRDYTIHQFNAQGSSETLSSIMTSVQNDRAATVICVGTVALQSAINKQGLKRIIFTGVADGVLAGAGKTPSDHAANVTGITTRSAFDEMAETIHTLMPDAKRIGTLFVPGEVNSVYYRNLFKKSLAQFGIELISVPVNSSVGINDSANTLCQMKPNVICQILDDLTRPGFVQIVRKANEANIPIVGFEDRQVREGAALAIARSYESAGKEAGNLAIRILQGLDPAQIPFSNVNEKYPIVNVNAAAKMHVAIPIEILESAKKIYGLGELHGGPYKVALVNMADNKPLEDARAGVIEGLCDMGLVEGTDFVITDDNAHGDMSLFPQIFGKVAQDKPDIVIPIGTPAVQAIAKIGSNVPVVFTVSGEPAEMGVDGAVKAGWMSGVYLVTPMNELVTMAIHRNPGATKFGVIYNPGEFISNAAVEKMRVACAKNGIELVERGISSANEASEAARGLVSENVDAILTSCDSIMNAAIPIVVKITKPADIPIYANELELTGRGADASIGYSFEDWGRSSGRMAALVLAGLKPSDVPPKSINPDMLREVEAPAPQ
jgi:ABC-type uncharacterized transport system substrate-binding protein